MVHLTELPIEILEKISTYCDRESLDNLARCYPIYKIIRESYFKELKPYFGIIKYRWRIEDNNNNEDDNDSDNSIDSYPYFRNENKIFISYELSKIKLFFFKFIVENIENGNKQICRANFFYKKINLKEKINFSTLKKFVKYGYINHRLCRLFDINYNYYYNEFYTGYNPSFWNIPLYNNTDYQLNSLYEENDIELIMLKNNIKKIESDSNKIRRIKKYLGSNKLVVPLILYKCCIFEGYVHENHYLKSSYINLAYVRIFNEECDIEFYKCNDLIKIKEEFKRKFPLTQETLRECKNVGIMSNSLYKFNIL